VKKLPARLIAPAREVPGPASGRQHRFTAAASSSLRSGPAGSCAATRLAQRPAGSTSRWSNQREVENTCSSRPGFLATFVPSTARSRSSIWVARRPPMREPGVRARFRGRYLYCLARELQRLRHGACHRRGEPALEHGDPRAAIPSGRVPNGVAVTANKIWTATCTWQPPHTPNGLQHRPQHLHRRYCAPCPSIARKRPSAASRMSRM